MSGNSAAVISSPSTRVQSMWRLRELLDNGGILLDAPYQREVVWPTPKMSMLIDSVLNNYYIPPLIFSVRKMKDTGKTVRICIDGKQRLTSIRRFMHNEIAYKPATEEGETSIPLYYMRDKVQMEENSRLGYHNKVRHYLDEETLRRFNDAEIICVEYTNLDDDQELEIFSRVQLGVSLTPAERLNANDSAMARFLRELLQEYRDLGLLIAGERSILFQCLSQLAYLVSVRPADFQPTVQHLSKWLAKNGEGAQPSESLKRSLRHTVQILEEIARHPDAQKPLMEVNGERVLFRPMEFLGFGLYISQCRRSQTLPDYINDLVSMRKYVKEHFPSNKSFSRNTVSYRVIRQWVEDRLSETGAMPAMVRSVSTTRPRSVPFGSTSHDNVQPAFMHQQEPIPTQGIAPGLPISLPVPMNFLPKEEPRSTDTYTTGSKRPLNGLDSRQAGDRHRSRPVARRGGARMGRPVSVARRP
ncbi:uncharacterized protein BYT42DRAFT_645862 [Radiomyces spectabilis]|uniref:uncharacterized protein n=1 Tax=Radiomyces spectabilis TaxID=64574 RepID=UPI00221F500C|nr:uncharacterized protein BYT42DRAFT_645862 [Radiomyces spectabilis]KAI8376222.1 hypothetical protein BYT42DRAFT_645862 [Radiomyces spectabilis]